LVNEISLYYYARSKKQQENNLFCISVLGTVFTLRLSSPLSFTWHGLNYGCQLTQECEYYTYVSMQMVSERQCLITNLITLRTALHKFASRDVQPASPNM